MHLENLTPFQSEFTMAFDSDGREMIVVSTKATFDIPQDPNALCAVAAVQRELQMADEVGPEPGMAPVVETDFVPFKPACDVLVQADAHAPHGKEVTGLVCGLEVGALRKSFRVVGPRVWQELLVGYEATPPKPFSSVPIGYAQAWGGADPDPSREGYFATYETNPAGVGYYPYSSELTGKPLPLTEAPNEFVTSANSNYTPMSFGPIARVWLPRRQYAGTYDEAWQRTRMPFPPKDLDSRFFLCAPPDQQMPYPRGGEGFSLSNLASHGTVSGVLPTTRVSVRYERKNGRMTQKVGIPDTVFFYPEDRQLTMVWRCHLKPERDIFELKQAVVQAQIEVAA